MGREGVEGRLYREQVVRKVVHSVTKRGGWPAVRRRLFPCVPLLHSSLETLLPSPQVTRSAFMQRC